MRGPHGWRCVMIIIDYRHTTATLAVAIFGSHPPHPGRVPAKPGTTESLRPGNGGLPGCPARAPPLTWVVGGSPPEVAPP